MSVHASHSLDLDLWSKPLSRANTFFACSRASASAFKIFCPSSLSSAWMSSNSFKIPLKALCNVFTSSSCFRTRSRSLYVCVCVCVACAHTYEKKCLCVLNEDLCKCDLEFNCMTHLIHSGIAKARNLDYTHSRGSGQVPLHFYLYMRVNNLWSGTIWFVWWFLGVLAHLLFHLAVPLFQHCDLTFKYISFAFCIEQLRFRAHDLPLTIFDFIVGVVNSTQFFVVW